ncbi:hypothetical protein Bbelb_202640 [Branchiostoma belcheri]|nr:hypothetical protein Bbelb_202640 [Branchiostoma belcheri]
MREVRTVSGHGLGFAPRRPTDIERVITQKQSVVTGDHGLSASLPSDDSPRVDGSPGGRGMTDGVWRQSLRARLEFHGQDFMIVAVISGTTRTDGLTYRKQFVRRKVRSDFACESLPRRWDPERAPANTPAWRRGDRCAHQKCASAKQSKKEAGCRPGTPPHTYSQRHPVLKTNLKIHQQQPHEQDQALPPIDRPGQWESLVFTDKEPAGHGQTSVRVSVLTRRPCLSDYLAAAAIGETEGGQVKLWAVIIFHYACRPGHRYCLHTQNYHIM